MAVYTKINKESLSNLLNNYEIGSLIDFQGIIEGVENTNYKITTLKNSYILTIFEKRVDEKDLPFFIELQNHLSNKKIRCPEPIVDKNNNFIQKIDNKKCVIMSFLEGKKIEEPTNEHCEQIGFELAKIHKNTQDFKLTRKNNLCFSKWLEIFNKCKQSSLISNKIFSKKYNHKKIKNYNDLFNPIEIELKFLKKNWPADLPKGIIHADVFKDNVFFDNNKLTGLIDFYFACNDFYAYELAICINDWCFNKDTIFEIDRYKSIINGYEKVRKLEVTEIKNMPILLRGSAMRFILTRLHDQLYHPKDALVEPKDPLEYFYFLETHQNIQNGLINIEYGK
tara:strand:+ start:7065 stop:8078 length:1014 start_codon:yes stop_codon:yes gene_type:complete